MLVINLTPFVFLACFEFTAELGTYHKIPNISPGWGGGGGGGTQHSFIRGGSSLRSKPLPFYIPFLREKVPLSYTLRKIAPPFIYLQSKFY